MSEDIEMMSKDIELRNSTVKSGVYVTVVSDAGDQASFKISKDDVYVALRRQTSRNIWDTVFYVSVALTCLIDVYLRIRHP